MCSWRSLHLCYTHSLRQSVSTNQTKVSAFASKLPCLVMFSITSIMTVSRNLGVVKGGLEGVGLTGCWSLTDPPLTPVNIRPGGQGWSSRHDNLENILLQKK